MSNPYTTEPVPESNPAADGEKALIGPHRMFAIEKAAGVVIAGALAVVGSVFALPLGILPAFGIALLGGLLIALGLVYERLIRRASRYELNEAVLTVKTGIIAREYDSVRLAFVLDADMRQTLIERLFGCGTIIIEMADRRRRILIPWVETPDEVRLFILQHAAKMRTMAVSDGGGCGGRY